MKNTYSQSNQDRFALQVCSNKTYLEIGGNNPRKWNNTFLLEHNGFKGISIEYNMKWKKDWIQSARINPIYFEDALNFDYVKALKENNLRNKLGYLSCDIEPAKKTFSALKRVIQSGVQFECITFEDDRYNEKENYSILAENFLKDYGYKVAVYDVTLENTNKLFETWFVHKSIKFKKTSYQDWKINL